MSANNSIARFVNASVGELQQSLGITNFSGESEWNQTIGGLILQGGQTPLIALDAELEVSFSIAFTKQVLGLFVSEIYDGTLSGAASGVFIKSNYSLNAFTIRNDAPSKKFFWFAVGV